MNKTLVREIASLVRQGWRPYNGQPDMMVYRNLKCKKLQEQEQRRPGQDTLLALPPLREDQEQRTDPPAAPKRKFREPCWFARGDIYLCLGCNRSCALSRPDGFALLLPIQYDGKEEGFTQTPAELLRCRKLLRTDEAAYCLNIGLRTVYDWIEEGKLRGTRDKPVRIPVEDVLARMNLLTVEKRPLP